MAWKHAVFHQNEDPSEMESPVRHRVCQFMTQHGLKPQDVQIIEARIAARPNISRETTLVVTIYYDKKSAAKKKV